MQTSYIYSVSRVNALSQFLLSKTDIERLLVADPGADLQLALKETYLAPFVVRVPEESVPLAIEQTLIDAKRMIHKISPNGNMFRVLWVQYDIHNLRVFAKATAIGSDFEACRAYLSERGIYKPDDLFEKIENDSLRDLQPGWQESYNAAIALVAEGKLDQVDGVFDALYFETSKRIAETEGDEFIKKYLQHFIDLYNLKSHLRHLKNESVNFTPSFISGGSFASSQIETLEQTIAMFGRYLKGDDCKIALELFENTGNFTRIDACSAEYFLRLAKEASADMFSSSSLVLYYLKCRQAAANIRAIVVGKNSGTVADDIRTNLRMAYVND